MSNAQELATKLNIIRSFLLSQAAQVVIFSDSDLEVAATSTPFSAMCDVFKGTVPAATELHESLNHKFSVAELNSLPEIYLYDFGFREWKGETKKLRLIPIWLAAHIKDGEILICITGQTVTIGRSEINMVSQHGCIAYGFEYSEGKTETNA